MSKSGQRASRADVGGQRLPKSPSKKAPRAQAEQRSAESGSAASDSSKRKKKEEPARKG